MQVLLKGLRKVFVIAKARLFSHFIDTPGTGLQHFHGLLQAVLHQQAAESLARFLFELARQIACRNAQFRRNSLTTEPSLITALNAFEHLLYIGIARMISRAQAFIPGQFLLSGLVPASADFGQCLGQVSLIDRF